MTKFILTVIFAFAFNLFYFTAISISWNVRIENSELSLFVSSLKPALTEKRDVTSANSSNYFFSNVRNTNNAFLSPTNDAICNAISIGCGADLPGTTVGATASSLGIPSCSPFGSQNDVFYKFSAIAGNTYTIEVSGSNYNGVLALYKGSCSGIMTELACSEDITYGTETIVFTPNSAMLIYIRTFDLALNGDFTISLDCSVPNDDPCDARLLACGQSVSGSTVGATNSLIGAPSCSIGIAKDVFYKIDAIAGVDYSVTISGVNYNGVLAAYTRSCDGTVTELDCAYGLLGIDHTIDFSVSFDQTVLIQTFYAFGGVGGSFQIDVSCSNFPNDDPCDAIELFCGESYSGSSAGASNSGLGNPSCTSGSENDVFFKFTAFANTAYLVTVGGVGYNGVIAAYTGLCSGPLTEIGCADNGATSGIDETIYILVPTEQEILIQTYDYNPLGLSNYSLTLHCPIPENDDCSDAITLTVNNPGECPANQVEGTTYGATPSYPDACESDSPDVYYIFYSGNNNEVIINLDYRVTHVSREKYNSSLILCSLMSPFQALDCFFPNTQGFTSLRLLHPVLLNVTLSGLSVNNLEKYNHSHELCPFHLAI
ncbi:hypothetical protein G3O08_14905 [Cryomorpha ignava]|uniref:T9SS-like galactose binding domain-containing protein n=1 Tax=Cryomorpha ignava TaxID=101383 RepID=A0A7K3WUR2_9FLAO|nr:hypothetical protein [Cryomorpha ignava]NEN24791.1 hypothetical protein [Cryomorpha ignava]